MHDKYYYEAAEMALIDTDVRRTFATGIAGFSHVVDSLSAVKYAKVKVIRDEEGVAVDFETEGDFPRYGNDDDRADDIAVWLLHTFLEKLKKYPTYRNSEPTTSIPVSYTHLDVYKRQRIWKTGQEGSPIRNASQEKSGRKLKNRRNGSAGSSRKWRVTREISAGRILTEASF